MLKKTNEYKTITEVLQEVKATGGIDTGIEFITHLQDLIGHSNAEDLEDLAGEYKETFYRVYQIAEGTTETLRFFAAHSNTCRMLRAEASEAHADADKYQGLFNDLQQIHKETQITLSQHVTELENKLFDAQTTADALTMENERLTAEITALKAKLYDLITK
jgi:hypothetical protein